MNEISILGAGIGGLAAGLALKARGLDATILERAPAISEVGAGLQVSPNGFVVLQALGLGPAIEKAGVRASTVRLINGETGREVARLPLGERPYHFLHRADLIDILAEAAQAAGIPLRLGQEITGVDIAERLTLTHANGATASPDFLIGADGLNSVTRAAICPGLIPKFTGQVAWRATLRAEKTEPPEVQVHMGTRRHLVRYPIRGGQLVNIVAVEERDAWVAEGWHHQDDPENLARAFNTFSTDIRNDLERIETTFLWGLHRHPVAPNWHNSGAVLLGDAAHPTLPFLAQGANMALEDAWVLARCLADGTGPETYETRRKRRTTRITKAAQANARNYHLPPGVKRIAAHTALRLASTLTPNLLTSRFNWLYDHDVTQA